MTFWGGSRLRDEGREKAIVQPFDPARIDCSAYELTLGAEAYVTPYYGDDLRLNLKTPLVEPTTESLWGHVFEKGGGTVVVPPGQFAFLLTEETVALPGNVMGFISLKSKPKFRGLINVSGFHVDPGFKGRLVYSVFNAGPSAIHLARGDRLFLLWIADLSGDDPEKKYQKNVPGYIEIPSSLISEVSLERHSLKSLSNRIDGIDESIRTIKTLAFAAVTVLSLLFAFLTLRPSSPNIPPISNPAVVGQQNSSPASRALN